MWTKSCLFMQHWYVLVLSKYGLDPDPELILFQSLYRYLIGRAVSVPQL
jgi:hypothetical protein